MHKGKVIFIKSEKGYGFIRDNENLQDHFFAANEMQDRFGLLEVGDSVIFEVVKDTKHGKRPKAVEVYRMEESKGEAKAPGAEKGTAAR